MLIGCQSHLAVVTYGPQAKGVVLDTAVLGVEKSILERTGPHGHSRMAIYLKACGCCISVIRRCA